MNYNQVFPLFLKFRSPTVQGRPSACTFPSAVYPGCLFPLFYAQIPFSFLPFCHILTIPLNQDPPALVPKPPNSRSERWEFRTQSLYTFSHLGVVKHRSENHELSDSLGGSSHGLVFRYWLFYWMFVLPLGFLCFGKVVWHSKDFHLQIFLHKKEKWAPASQLQVC